MKKKNNPEDLDNKDIRMDEIPSEEPSQKKDDLLEKESSDLLKKQLEEQKDRYMRLFADFENYKRRREKDFMDLSHRVYKDFFGKLLPFIHDFTRALEQMKNHDDKKQDLYNQDDIKGIGLIYKKLMEILQKMGLEEIPAKKGDVFDIDFHEAFSQMNAPSPELKGKIMEIYSKGYKIGNDVIEYVKVIIGS